MSNEQATFAQRSQKKVHFDHKEMDYYFSWILGREIYEGADEGECLEAASRISDGDAVSWGQVFRDLADSVKTQAQAAEKEGDLEAARKSYLRACTYYRAPLFMMGPKEDQFDANWRAMRACFQRAAAMFTPQIEVVRVPYHGEELLGYFWKVDDRQERRPTLHVIGGMETFSEDCYFFVGQEGARRGYNVIAVDLPGQGDNPTRGLYLEARMDPPVSAVIDYALTRPEIDPERLASYGFSWGGHIVLQGAERDSRIQALAANPPMPDVFKAGRAQQQGGHGRSDPIVKAVFDQIAWRFGLQISLKIGPFVRRLIKAFDYLRYGKADVSRIRQPALLMAGEGEAQITLELARECYQKMPNPQNKLKIFTREEGGEAHCQVDNLGLPNDLLFDWLAEIFKVGN